MERITLVDNSRQAGMQEALGFNAEQEVHVIIGCGGIGFWLGLMLAMMGGQRFILIDGDKIDHSNLSRLPVPQTWVGINKTVALRKIIRSLRPDCIVSCLTTHITEDTLGLLGKFVKSAIQEYDIRVTTVWDTTDDARIQTHIHKTVKELVTDRNNRGIQYRKIGYEGFKVANYMDYSVWTQEGYTTGYRTTQANAVSSALSAGIGLFSRYLTTNDVNIDLKKLIQKGE